MFYVINVHTHSFGITGYTRDLVNNASLQKRKKCKHIAHKESKSNLPLVTDASLTCATVERDQSLSRFAGSVFQMNTHVLIEYLHSFS